MDTATYDAITMEVDSITTTYPDNGTIFIDNRIIPTGEDVVIETPNVEV